MQRTLTNDLELIAGGANLCSSVADEDNRLGRGALSRPYARFAAACCLAVGLMLEVSGSIEQATHDAQYVTDSPVLL